MKNKFSLFAISLMCLGALSSCGDGRGNLSIKEGDQIFEDRIIYEANATNDVFYRLNSDKKITEVACRREVADLGKDIAYNDEILEIKGSFMSKLNAGERTIDVTFSDNSKTKIDCIVATKIIKTADDFQNINENLQGTYVLGNDIDLSSIANFEPLGYMFDETSTRNDYFHGILDGNGYSVKNAKVYYSNNVRVDGGINDNNVDVYQGDGLFQHDAHKAGDNIGLFQVIGSQGIVRNVRFDNIKVRGRTIVGVLAGNNKGLIENCVITDTCTARMSTHFYDNDCNMGGVVGINSGEGQIIKTICLTSQISVPNVYTDYDNKYIGETGNGWDHENDDTCNWWRFANVNRPISGSQEKEIDSNGHATNGVYAFAGKTWGVIKDCIALSFTKTVYEGEATIADFAQTHRGELKPTSGDTDMGSLDNCKLFTLDEFKDASNYEGFDTTIWNFKNGSLPTLSCPSYKTSVYSTAK